MIAIKGLKEMPSCCYECPYYDDYCRLTSKWDGDTEQIRDADCPLVEIVTCKDCKYYRNGLEHCTQWVMPTNDDFYCADAERSV